MGAVDEKIRKDRRDAQIRSVIFAIPTVAILVLFIWWWNTHG